jgi:hypothetical protein
MEELSNEMRDKLFAALNHDVPDPRHKLPFGYIQACILWYGALSAVDRRLVATCSAAYARRHEQQAAAVAEALPPAPKWPL